MTELSLSSFADLSPTSVGLPRTTLADSLLRIARGQASELAALLHDVELHTVVDGTRVISHCHSLKLDAAGRPRIAELAQAVAEFATEFAIPRSQIARALEHARLTGSFGQINRLYDTAKSLFTDLENSGEGGELLLFAVAERILRLPQLMCKMSLKTNTRMHVHGADGVHAGVDRDTGRLALYWGESKIYGDATSAIRECLASIAPMLIEAGPRGQSTRDLQLLDRAIDLSDHQLEQALRRYLDPRDPAFLELEIRGLCLVGFDCDAYGRLTSETKQQELVDVIVTQLPTWKTGIARRVAKEALGDFSMHFICVPFPSADSFRNELRLALGIINAD